jgi:transcriptional regulator of acetoin/glycerol metabolism
VVTQSSQNVLLVGTPSATQEILDALAPHLPGPVETFRSIDGQRLSRLKEGTLILLEVETLRVERQLELLEWLNQGQSSNVHIVSTTSRPLFSLVRTGTFLPDLYYRLNVVRMDLTDVAESTTAPLE